MKLRRILPAFAVICTALIFIADFIAFFLSKLITDNVDEYVDLITPLDKYVPFIPWFIYIYILSFAFWIVTPIVAAKIERVRYYRFASATIVSLLICGIIFIAVPTYVYRPQIETTSVTTWLINFIYSCDTPTNLFPSVHCLISWFCYISVRGQKVIPLWFRVFTLIFALMVFASTVCVSQHILVDIPSAVILAEAVWFVSKKTKLYVPLMKLCEKAESIIYKETSK